MKYNLKNTSYSTNPERARGHVTHSRNDRMRGGLKMSVSLDFRHFCHDLSCKKYVFKEIKSRKNRPLNLDINAIFLENTFDFFS